MRKIILASLLILIFSSYSQSQICNAIMPNQKKSFDTSVMRGLADNYYLWNNGQKIYVKFLSGSITLQNKIKSFAKEWEKYANFSFVFIVNGNSNVRIKLDSTGGHNSLVGTLANTVPQNEKTMNLDTSDFISDQIIKRTVLHEFGHVLGLLHEHFSPISGISWNKKVVYSDLLLDLGWDSSVVNQNIFQTYKLSYTNGTLFDKFSIMEYPIKLTWTYDGYSVSWNDNLSSGDKKLIGALYPLIGKRQTEVPRFQVTGIKNIEIINSKLKEGLLIYPKFTISTAGKEGTVYFIVFFYNQDGTPLEAFSTDYKIDKNIATFKAYTLPPNLSIKANNGKHDFELYIPYSVFPMPIGKAQQKCKIYSLLIS